MEHGFAVGVAENGTELKLAMQRLWVTGHILPVGARLLVQHTFRNGEDRSLEVVYGFMLPRDAALRSFHVEGEGFEAHSELRRVQEAVKAYEEGIQAGHLATLARSYRDGVVNLTLGNLRKGECVTVTLDVLAGVELHDNGLRFRFPFALAPGYHSQARTFDDSGTGEMELPSNEFGDVILPRFKKDSEGLHEVGFDLALRIPGTITEIGSPSHAVRMREDQGTRRVALAPAADVPNRDLVLDVRMAEPCTQIMTAGRRFAAVVPSIRFGTASSGPRRIGLVIDRSGSMSGEPLTQAKRAVEACLASLSSEDQFALVAFDDRVETFRERTSPADSKSRAAAGAFLQDIVARGGTALALGFAAAARMVPGGDVLVATDGQVMGTEDILAEARASNVRIHCLGIGSASQDRFLAMLASATGGTSRFVTPRERVDVAAIDLFAGIGRPVASNVAAGGARFEVSPATTVFAGSPWVIFGESTGAALDVSWTGGSFTLPFAASNPAVEETLMLLEGSRLITELESRMTGEAATEIETRLAAVSQHYGLASRATSLVAVVKRLGDHAGAPPETRVVPVGMPRDTKYSSYFPPAAPMAMMPGAPVRKVARDLFQTAAGMFSRSKPAEMFSRSKSVDSSPIEASLYSLESIDHAGHAPQDEYGELLNFARRLEPDGGLPGADLEDRVLQTAAAVLLFLAKDHTTTDGAFRAHVEKMVRFLEGVSTKQHDLVQRVIAFARAGRKPKWPSPAPGNWKQLEALLA